MKDKKILELAAIACGLLKEGVFYGSTDWNPLKNDGDAFRLAARLMMSVDFGTLFSKYTIVTCSHRLDGVPRIAIKESHNSDVFYATRRAIVRAAAEIGETHNASLTAKHAKSSIHNKQIPPADE